MENTVKERLKLYLRINRITQEKFCNSVGVAPTYVSNIRKGIQPDKLTRIQQAYPDLNIEWLVTGRGEMLNSTPTTTEDTTDTQENIVRVIPIAAHGGMLTNFDIDSIEGVKCETIISPIAGAELAISVTGSSMEPSYPNGSRVLIKSINHNAYIAWGEVYVIDTCNGTLLKELQPGQNEGYVKCVSHNPDERYKPFEVPLAEVRKIYKVLACITLR